MSGSADEAVGVQAAKVGKKRRRVAKKKPLGKAAKKALREGRFIRGRDALDQTVLRKGEAKKMLVALWPASTPANTVAGNGARALLKLGNEETRRVGLSDAAVKLLHRTTSQHVINVLRNGRDLHPKRATVDHAMVRAATQSALRTGGLCATTPAALERMDKAVRVLKEKKLALKAAAALEAHAAAAQAPAVEAQ